MHHLVLLARIRLMVTFLGGVTWGLCRMNFGARLARLLDRALCSAPPVWIDAESANGIGIDVELGKAPHVALRSLVRLPQC